ncbi:tetratricopeptide repeat protein [Streptomyces sp. NPDC057877]|uniref:tetratricopeptide repeat protein n=1 Tax=Streptomyces sp. NPDC057877 TaxID=3346269 RepID=UPI0036BE552A
MATADLPPVPVGFTGREEDLARLMPVLDPGAVSDLPVVICAVSGLGGIGKTSLALCAGHRAVGAGWFPGGTLFVDFRGYDEDPVTADQALIALLDGMDVRASELPQTAHARYALYRRRLSEERRPMLLVLDNVSDPAQVTPLFPGADQHRVLITSRDRLTDLDARLLDLDVLKPEAAAGLVDRSLRLSDGDDDRAAREPEAVAELAELCGHHPLALRIAVGMLRKRRYRAIASLAGELRAAEDRAGALGVRPVFEVAYGQLPLEQARLLRLVCVAPTAEVSGEAAEALAGLGAGRTAELLEELAASHLVTPVPTDGAVRWRLHDLVRAFGVSVVTEEEAGAARERLLEFYDRWADAADDRLRWLPGLPEPERFADRGAALAWLDGERAGLVAAVQWADDERHGRAAVRLASRLAKYLSWRRYFDDLITTGRSAQEAAHRTGDTGAEAIAWAVLGGGLLEAGLDEEAIDAHESALGLYQVTGDRLSEADVWNNLGTTLRLLKRADEAIEAHTRARDLYRDAGNRNREGHAWSSLGLALRFAGRTQQAIDALTHARDLLRSTGDRHGEGMAWHGLGDALRHAGRAAEAIEVYGEALKVWREFEDRYAEGRALYGLALVHRDLDQDTEAYACYLRSADAFTRADAPAEATHAQSAADALT